MPKLVGEREVVGGTWEESLLTPWLIDKKYVNQVIAL